MRKLIASFLIVFVPIGAFAQSALWQDVRESEIATKRPSQVLPQRYRTLRLNTVAMAQLLNSAPMEFSDAAKTRHVIITLPKADGGFWRFEITESPMVSPQVAAEAPDWKTYSGQGIEDRTATVRLSWSKEGLRAFIIGADGSHYLDPYSPGDPENYIAYRKQDLEAPKSSFHCEIDRLFELGKRATAGDRRAPIEPAVPEFSNGANLRTYRIAIATTGEYTVDRGGQATALADVMNAVNRLILIYRRDLSLTFTLVSGTNTVFPDPATDPYDNTDNGAQLTINQTTLDNTIGAANYDIGHLFGTGGGGVALSPSVCSTQKAQGYSARVPPTGDSFWVDYVAHEIGHQFAGKHTYNTSEGPVCSTRSAPNAFEIASGSTIMSYVGICGDRNQQRFSFDNFHIRSLTQMLDQIENGESSTCGTSTPTGNNVPVAGAGAGFTIPKLTPFTLTATATDADNDPLTYSWEEYDLAPSASGPNGVPPGTYDVDTDGVLRPLFRVYAPAASSSRTYPSLTYILNNANTPPLTFTGTSPTGAVCRTGDTCVTGENLPSVARTMNFRVAVRDNKGGISDAGVAINIDAASGPFVVTAPNTAVTVAAGSQLTVNWNVANTTATPVSAANVKISLSTDGGTSFAAVLAASVPNNGTANVTVPNLPTTTARIKVEAVGNIFFDISDANFTITGNGAPGLVGNISTRLPVGTGDNALIEGFIIQGPAGSTKKLLVRAIGPSLAAFGVTDAVANPTLGIFDASNAQIASNDNWKTTQVGGIITGDQFAEINGSGVAPGNDLESAIVADLTPASYTAVVRGANNTVGTGVVDAYDLSPASTARVANVATRGLVQPGDRLLIGGFIIQNGPVRVVVRAIGPSLAAFGITNALPDTTLQLRDQNGNIVRENDDWMTDQAVELQGTGLQPTNNLEAALVQTIQPGQYTAQVRGKPETTGTGLVEVYFLQ
ncbi:MAG TPA: zinc-dependent metalloprotease family protein [Chthoniobacterales bacterium]|nr:zinc-dependent metalloprotease family protein [Chthoniobacterales bacterium]